MTCSMTNNLSERMVLGDTLIYVLTCLLTLAPGNFKGICVWVSQNLWFQKHPKFVTLPSKSRLKTAWFWCPRVSRSQILLLTSKTRQTLIHDGWLINPTRVKKHKTIWKTHLPRISCSLGNHIYADSLRSIFENSGCALNHALFSVKPPFCWFKRNLLMVEPQVLIVTLYRYFKT